MKIRLILNSISGFLVTALTAIIASFLPLFTAYLFTPYVNDMKYTHGEDYVQNLLSIAGFILFTATLSLIAFLRGKRKTKNEKLTNAQYRMTSSIAMGAYMLPAIILVSLISNVYSMIRVIAFYLPFLYLKDMLKFMQLSVIILGFLGWAAQVGAFALGRLIWTKNKDEA